MKEQEARDTLRKKFYDFDHPNHCREADPHWVKEDTDLPDYDKLLIIKCWNCGFQDHFLID